MSHVDLETIRRGIHEEMAAAPSSGRPAFDPGAAAAGPVQPSPGAALARLPLIGPLLRWLHGVVKAPARIRDLHRMSRLAAARIDRLQGDLEGWRDQSQAAGRRIEERFEVLAAAIAEARGEAASSAGEAAHATAEAARATGEAARAAGEARQATARTDHLLLALEAWRDLSRAATQRAEARLDVLAAEAASALAQATRTGTEESRARQALAARLLQLEEWRAREDSTSIPGAEDLLARIAAIFRGGEEMITERLRAHLPVLLAAPPVAAGRAVLDLGCGRGEWLVLLKSAGIAATGVDTSEATVRHCRAAGLEVRRQDLVAALEECPDDTLGAVTAIQVAEHLPYAVLVRLIDEARRALAPGGLLLIETPNPDNLRVAAADFRLDPTHRQPIPSRLLALLLEARGFERVGVRDLHPLPEPEGSTLDPTVRAALWGPQDYVVAGWKPPTAASAEDNVRATTSGE